MKTNIFSEPSFNKLNERWKIIGERKQGNYTQLLQQLNYWNISRYPPSLPPVYRTAIPCYYKKAFCIHRIMKSRGKDRFLSLHILLCDHSTKAYSLYWGRIYLLINTIFLKNHILKKLTQNYTPILNFCTANWQKAILSFISLTKEAAEQSSCCFKRSAGEAFRLFPLTLDRCLFVCLHDQAGKVIFYLCPIN